MISTVFSVTFSLLLLYRTGVEKVNAKEYMYVHEISTLCTYMYVSVGLSNPHEFSFTVDDDSSQFTLKKVRVLQGGVRSRNPFPICML